MRQTGKHRARRSQEGLKLSPGFVQAKTDRFVARRGRNAWRLLQMEMDT